MAWTPADIPDLTGVTALVTGANSGLGLETSRELARHGAHVVMAVRDLHGAGNEARKVLLKDIPAAKLDLLALDLEDRQSIRAAADGAPAVVDYLILNAGLGTQKRELTADGIERAFAVNHLGHFAFTGLLLPRLVHARIVSVTSGFMRRAQLDLDDLSYERPWKLGAAYAASKLAVALFGVELDRRLRSAGYPAVSLLAHPGIASTPMQQKTTGLVGLLSRSVSLLLGQPATAGAWSQLRAATDSTIAGGTLVGPAGRREMRGNPVPVDLGQAEDPDAAQDLWRLSQELTGVAYLDSTNATEPERRSSQST